MQKLNNISSAIFNNSYYHNKLSLHSLSNKFCVNAKYGGNYDNYRVMMKAKQAEEEYEAIYHDRHKYDRLKDYKNLLYCISDYGERFYKIEKMTYYTKSIVYCEILKLSYYAARAKRKARREQYES